MISTKLYVEAARRLHHEDGEVEIDDRPRISRSEDQDGEQGAYVQAWVWVPREEARHKKVPYGVCRICGHYGEDCTGEVKP